MSLKTKSIKKPRMTDDGLCISIMSRHTLNDGVTPDEEITKESFDEWWPELAPPLSLIGAYYKQGLPWKDFEREFRNYLQLPQAQARLQSLVALAQSSTVTILCIESTPEHCHRRLVAEMCHDMDALLEILIE